MTGMLWLAGGISRIVVWAQRFFVLVVRDITKSVMRRLFDVCEALG